MSSLTDTLPQRMALPLAAACALGCAATLLSGIWFFIGGAETDVAAPPATSAPEAIVSSARTPLGAAEIAALNLFGVLTEETETETVQRMADAPETRLQLELQGVFLADEAEQSSVIVAERNRDGKLYKVGDRLPGNAVLVEVFGDRIVLRRAGQLETLKFFDAAPGGAFVAGRSGSAGPQRSATRGRNSGPGASLPLSGSPGRSAPIAQSRASGSARASAPGEGAGAQPSLRARLQDLSERLNVDPTGTLAEYGVQPVGDGGSGGYRLGGEIPSSTLAQVGLRPGDVVLSVNGQSVGNIQQDRAQIDSIMDAGSARLEIQRGDRRFFVTTRIR
ncbi:MAG: type II secretion system protein N [Pseudomonadota bacterium]|nr:type II secretion system protein N [Pseudomonadota bacterium]